MTAWSRPSADRDQQISDRPDRWPGRSGHGLIGMRERVALFGGTLEAGARPGRRLPGRRPPPAGQRLTVSIRVLVADDQASVRVGFLTILNAPRDLEVVGEAADGAEAMELASGRPRPTSP